MPSPVGRPAETVSPDVSECSRMPDRRRPAARATSPCAPSWAIVTTCRVGRQSVGERTSTAATAAVPRSTSGRRSGDVAVTCAQNRPRTSTSAVNPMSLGGPARRGRSDTGSTSEEGECQHRGVQLLVSLPAFLLAVLLISASPGPAMALILRRAALRGWRAAVPTVLGLELGLYCWALFAGAGFAALVAASETAYLVLRVVGAAVLLWLGVRAYR